MIPHARQLRAAIWSHKTAQEGKYNRFASAKTGKTDAISVYVFEFKVGGEFAGGDDVSVHSSNDFAFFQIWSNISTVNFPVNVFCWLG